MAVVQNLSIVLAILASLAALLYKPLTLRIDVFGLNRPLDKVQNIHGEDLQVIRNTLYTEDLHHHLPSGLLFGASEEKAETRYQWFPPYEETLTFFDFSIGNFNDSHATDRGTIIVIDPETKGAKRLTLTNFEGPFITHGIEIYSPKDEPNSVYIFAINHLPNPAYVASNGKILPEARSQVELFHHTIGSSEANHLKSIWHPLIRTPNDIYALSANSIYVTNDHYYRSGPLRSVEDVGFSLTAWSDIIHLTLNNHAATTPPSEVVGSTALSHIQNPNGLGHGKSSDEILINRAAAGLLELAQRRPGGATPELQITDSVQVSCTIDNPSYFHDPYAKVTGRDASGYVLAGLVRGIAFPSKERRDPVVVWLVQRPSVLEGRGFTKKKIFQDDGRKISTASTAVVVAIDPAKNGGRKQGWLFVTGPMSVNVVVTRVDL